MFVVGTEWLVNMMRMRAYRVAVILAMMASFLLIGCSVMERKINVEVVVYNYLPVAVGEIRIQGNYIGGYYTEHTSGGTGGKIYCCIEVNPGVAEVSWEIDRQPGVQEPPEGWVRAARAEIPRPDKEDKFLGVHIYPGEVVEFTLTSNIRPEKPQGVPYD